MTTLREAAQQALEALESCDAAHPSDGGQQWYDEKLVEPAILALRAALAEPVQEPLADMAVFDLADALLYGGKNYGVLAFARAIERAHNIGT